MIALAVAKACGVSTADASDGISSIPSPKMRVAFEKIGKATVINDAYNSNPGSARAALELLASNSASQKVVILGTMRELGAASERMHDDIAITALKSGADIIAGIGEFAPALRKAGDGKSNVITATDVADLWPILEPKLQPEATILLKASRGVALERILPYINDWASKNC